MEATEICRVLTMLVSCHLIPRLNIPHFKYATYYKSIKAELSLQAEALALELRALWVLLSNTNRSDARQPSVGISGTTVHAGSLGALSLESCQLFLEKLNRACVVFISCADELEENCYSLNDEIAKDKDIYRDTTGYRYENLYLIYFTTQNP